MSELSIPCTCGRSEGHRLDCPVGMAFRYRCPECKSIKRNGIIVRHANHCPFKGVTRP